MDNVDERDPRVACDTTPEICALDVEVVTAEERRHVFESIGNAAVDPRVTIDRRLLEALGREVVEPRGEIFDGEGEALLAVLVDEQDGHIFAARVLAQAAIEVAACPEEGTRAGRLRFSVAWQGSSSTTVARGLRRACVTRVCRARNKGFAPALRASLRRRRGLACPAFETARS
jgi:hypothetical protein